MVSFFWEANFIISTMLSFSNTCPVGFPGLMHTNIFGLIPFETAESYYFSSSDLLIDHPDYSSKK